MDILRQRNTLLPTMLAFWLVLSFFYVLCKAHAGAVFNADYIVALAQIAFDFVAFWMMLDIFKKSAKGDRFFPFCATLGIFFLVLADFFFHGLVKLEWFQVSLMSQNLFYDVPLTLFFSFMLLAWGRLFMLSKSQGSSWLLWILAILSLALVMMLFFTAFTTTVIPHLSKVGMYYSGDTILQAVGIMFALLVMARVSLVSVQLLVVGYLVVVVADLFINIRAELGLTMAGGPELFWMLGSMLIAAGAYIRAQELQAGDSAA